MDRQLTRYYLQQSGMQPSQAEMLSAILDEMATRSELQEFRSEMRAELRDVRSEIQVLRADMVSELKSLEARLSWRFIAGIAFFASVMTVLDLFVH